ncbi:MAG: sulfur carrier protein ThiS [Reichenbachiella sp.]
MTIRVNDQALEIQGDFNILQLLDQIQSPTDGIAVAIDDTIVLKEQWASQTLTENDQVLIIQATQGG